ncbi:unnamed protein product [Allacma fusca]|uniref:Uncharacterized protein n=1 Tax=Allacma fusca TaxID=39272 RepID=A0A8J2KHL2_9HEXA|nr:unnamed protein product [Allacma fusca]
MSFSDEKLVSREERRKFSNLEPQRTLDTRPEKVRIWIKSRSATAALNDEEKKSYVRSCEFDVQVNMSKAGIWVINTSEPVFNYHRKHQ